MCQIILKPAGIVMPDGWLGRAAKLNPHGYGVACVYNESLEVCRNPELCSLPGDVELWHFRYALSGRNDPESIQPFMYIDGKRAFAHVGVLKEWAHGEHSDSRMFWDEYQLYPTPDRMLEAYCNVTQNRMVILNEHGQYKIFGENQGFWENGIWLSGVLE